ncbi:MAG: nodulation protein NfeD [Limnochordaceae bacterium]|nr:nodulation protein NfeD [Limnochordaceae bacterium]
MAVLLTPAAPAVDAAPSRPRRAPIAVAPGKAPVVYVVPVRGVIELGLAAFVRRAVSQAQQAGADALMLDVNTPGGRLDAGEEIRDALLDARLPTVAFVSERAQSAGALVSLAADYLVMAPAASIGAAEPIPAEEKIVSAVRAEFEATAQAKGRDPRIAAAMVDKSVAIPGLVEAGKLLTLPAREALEFGFADAIAPDREQAAAAVGLRGARFVEVRPNWAERLVRFLTEPTVSSLLLTIGFLGMIYELATAGWGVAGTVGLVALGLFFGARLLTGLAGWEVVLLFLVGVALLVVELVAVPGFGIAGVPGLLAVFASLYLSFRDAASAAYVIGGAIAMTALVAVLTFRYVRRTRTWSQIVLGARQRREEGYLASSSMSAWEGKRGRAVSPLRPAGVVEIEGMRVDASTEGEFVDAGTAVEVVRVDGLTLVVRPVTSRQERAG